MAVSAAGINSGDCWRAVTWESASWSPNREKHKQIWRWAIHPSIYLLLLTSCKRTGSPGTMTPHPPSPVKRQATRCFLFPFIPWVWHQGRPLLFLLSVWGDFFIHGGPGNNRGIGAALAVIWSLHQGWRRWKVFNSPVPPPTPPLLSWSVKSDWMKDIIGTGSWNEFPLKGCLDPASGSGSGA